MVGNTEHQALASEDFFCRMELVLLCMVDSQAKDDLSDAIKAAKTYETRHIAKKKESLS